MNGRFFLGLLAPLVVATVQAGDWHMFSSTAGRFSILMPGTPTEDKQDVKTAAGDITVTSFLVEVKNEGSLMVSFADFPEAALKGGNDEKRLDSARDLAILSSKGKLKFEKRITLGDYPGRELTIESDSKDGSAVRTRIFAVKERLFQTLVVGTKAFVGAKDADRFLTSFKLKK